MIKAIKRYVVTVEREVIIYASSRAEAGRKACAAVTYGMGTAQRPITVTKVKRVPLPEKEERGPIIDRAPAREIQK